MAKAEESSKAAESQFKGKLDAMSKDMKRLREDNERLSEQLAASVERPKADGQEQQQNGHNEGNKWEEKLNAIQAEKESL